jgi:hypothetical protein
MPFGVATKPLWTSGLRMILRRHLLWDAKTQIERRSEALNERHASCHRLVDTTPFGLVEIVDLDHPGDLGVHGVGELTAGCQPIA